MQLVQGAHVEAQFEATHFEEQGLLGAVATCKWWPGVLVAELEGGHWKVEYDDGCKEDVAPKYIRDSSAAQVAWNVGDASNRTACVLCDRMRSRIASVQSRGIRRDRRAVPAT